MDFDQIQTFLMIVKLHSFSKTAEKLMLTQPTVSNRIAALEEQLECKLFERNGRSFTLTREGALFVDYAKNITKQINGAREAIKQLKKPQTRIGFSPSFSSQMINNSLQQIDLNQLYISIHKGINSAELIEQLLQNELDIVFTTNPVSHTSLSVEKIFDDQMVFAVHPDHNLAQFEEITNDVLEGETLICYQRNLPLWKEIEKTLMDIPLNRLEANDIGMINELVTFGRGFTILPALAVHERSENICLKPFKQLDGIKKAIYAVHHHYSLEQEHNQIIVDCVKEQLRLSMSSM